MPDMSPPVVRETVLAALLQQLTSLQAAVAGQVRDDGTATTMIHCRAMMDRAFQPLVRSSKLPCCPIPINQPPAL
jgi:hypothetical protein